MNQWQRIASLSLAGLILITSVTVPLREYLLNQRYKLDADTVALVGNVNKNLAAKLQYNAELSRWDFNAAGLPASSSPTGDNLQSLKAQAGGAGENDDSLYAASFPSDPKEGMKFYDSQTQLSFTMTPQFELAAARESEGRLVYPMKHGAKLIYSAKNNGMKEDIIIPKFIGKRQEFTYKLSLPAELVPKLLGDGSVGIYSADPVLFGNVSTGSDMDAEKLESARKTAEKDHLLFALPAPVIVQTGDAGVSADVRFELTGNTLKVVADNMDKLRYPVSVDPSIVVTSTSQFIQGNNEDNIAYPTDQIDRASLTGGSLHSWASTSSGTFTARFGGGSVAYNNYVYYIGGHSGSIVSEVNFAPINSNGTLGSWSTTTALPSARAYSAAMVYNGRMYVYGGYTSGTSALNSVIYADINSDGTLGSWTTASNTMAASACRFGSSVYEGRLYAAGGATGTVASACGNSSSTMSNSTQSAPILANGDVGAWTTSASTFSTARKDGGLAIYNGYAYLTSGTTNGITTFRETQIAKVDSSGDLVDWRTSSELLPTNGKYRFGFRAHNGYLYLLGGTNNLTGTLYAKIYANGDIGPWQTGSTMSTGRYAPGFAFYNGYAYFFGGNSGSAYLNDTGYAKLDDAGIATTTTASSPLSADNSNAVTGPAVFVNNGYIYVAGGYAQTSSYTNRVLHAKINSDGSLGSWSTTTSMLAPVSGGTGLGSQGYAVSNNRVYMVGGETSTGGGSATVSSIQYASFNANGTLGSWTMNSTDYVGAVSNQPATAYNGYIYMVGNSGSGPNDRLYYAPINSDGSVGSWTWDGGGSNQIPESSNYSSMVTYNGYIYIVGGNYPPDGSSSHLSTVSFAKLNTNGSLDAWDTTSSLSVGRSRFGLAIVNGHLYAMGGEINPSSGFTDSVEYAPINSDGSLGSWVNNTNLSGTFSDSSATSWGDTIYLVSGKFSNARTKNVYSISVRNGGSGANGAWTASSNSLTAARRKFGSAVYNGYVYSVGGVTSGGTRLSSVEYAKLSDDGTTDSWSTTSALPSERSAHGVVAYKGRLFVIGGETSGGTATSTTYSAAINTNGTLGSWTAQTSLPTSLSSIAIAIDGSRLYVLGGTDSSPSSSVYYTTLSEDGSMANWTTTTSFSGARYGSSAVVNASNLYVLGGIDSSGDYYKDVQYAPINTNGTLGSWKSASDMVSARAYGTADVNNGFMYLTGGNSGTSARSNVEFAAIAKRGGTGNWATSTPLTNARQDHQAVIYNGYLYSIGGYDGSTVQTDVRSSPLYIQSRASHYSKLFDFGSLYTPTGISYSGSLATTDALSYRSAGTNGQFGATALASSIEPQDTINPCGSGSVQYIQVRALLDDTTNAAFPDTNSSSYVTNLTVSYNLSHATPDKRLAHGKYFQDETLQSLDTCAD